MSLSRRSFVKGGVGSFVGTSFMMLSGCGGFSTDQPEETPSETDSTPEGKVLTGDDIPMEIQKVKDLATALKRDAEASEYPFKEIRIFIKKDASQIVFNYISQSKESNEFQMEFEKIALMYADLASEYDDPPSLLIRLGKVEGVVSKHSVKAYNNGNLEKDAFLKTIAIR